MKIVRAAFVLLAFLFVALSPDAVAADKKKAAVKAPPGMAALPLELPIDVSILAHNPHGLPRPWQMMMALMRMNVMMVL